MRVFLSEWSGEPLLKRPAAYLVESQALSRVATIRNTTQVHPMESHGAWAHQLRRVCVTATSVNLCGSHAFVHAASVAAAAPLLPALSFYIDFAFDNGEYFLLQLSTCSQPLSVYTKYKLK